MIDYKFLTYRCLGDLTFVNLLPLTHKETIIKSAFILIEADINFKKNDILDIFTPKKLDAKIDRKSKQNLKPTYL
jgi:hypothetical protein